MGVTMFEIMLREKIDETEEKLNLYTYMRWRTGWLVKWRHMLLVALLQEQLENFSRDI